MTTNTQVDVLEAKGLIRLAAIAETRRGAGGFGSTGVKARASKAKKGVASRRSAKS